MLLSKPSNRSADPLQKASMYKTMQFAQQQPLGFTHEFGFCMFFLFKIYSPKFEVMSLIITGSSQVSFV